MHLAYLYDHWNLIRESNVSGSTQQTVRQYVWGLDLSQSMQGAGGVGGLLAAVHGTNVYYPCYDANGNITQYVNSSSGTTVARYDYDAFGREFHSSGTMANEFVFRFSTKYTDDETGLVYYGYRYCNPELGRWINRDPIGERGGLNIYSAFLNEGLSFCDPASGEVMYTGPHRGWVSRKIASMCPHTRKPIPEYQHTCSPAYALRSDESDGIYSPCPDDLVTVGDYHTHPTSGPTPGSGDHEWAAGRRYNPRCGSGSYVGAPDHDTFCRYGQSPADNIHLPLVPESRAERDSEQ